MKYLKNLPNHNAYEAFINSDKFTEIQAEKNNVISFCKQEEHVHYNPYIPPVILAQPLDILYSDANGNLSFTSEILPVSDGLTPIAICIAGTNFFGDNEPARWMALKYAGNSAPFIGIREGGVAYGNFSVDLDIPNMQLTHNGGAADGYMLVSHIDNSSQTNTIPVVLNSNNEWNLAELGTKNSYAITDVNGKSNTAIMLQATSRQPTWQTDTSITNNVIAGYAPAACCCARYHTLGTQEGDWYLGACGEIALIYAQMSSLRNKVIALLEVYQNNELYLTILDGNQFLTSTEYNSEYVYCINFSNGYIWHETKDYTKGVVPLLQYC